MVAGGFTPGGKDPAAGRRKQPQVLSPAQKLVQALGAPQKPIDVINRGCAVISEDLLRQLRDEVGFAPIRVLAADANDTKEAKGPSQPLRSPIKSRPGAQVGKNRPAVRDAAIAMVRDMAVGTDDEDCAPAGRRHAAIGTDDKEPIPWHMSGHADNAVPSHAPMLHSTVVASITPAVQLTSPRKVLGDFTQGRGAEVVPLPLPISAPDSPHVFGRCDLFTVDRESAERDQNRKRLQAQMLADQVEEQRKRKLDDKRRRKEEDEMEEHRLLRERRELQERHDREHNRLAPPARIPPEEVSHSPSRARRKHHEQVERATSPVPATTASPAGGFRGTVGADSTAGPWEDSPPPVRRKRRAKRSTAGSGATWRTADRDQKRNWHDPHGDSLTIQTDDQRTSHSPAPWVGTAENATDALTRVREGSDELQKSEVRRRRSKPRGQPRASAERGTEHRQTRGDMWDTYEDEHHRLRAGSRRPRRHRTESGDEPQATAVLALPSPDRLSVPKMTEDELREQLGSLMRVCEQLLRDRAERDGVPPAMAGGNMSRSPRRQRGIRSSAGLDSSPPSGHVSRTNSIQTSPNRPRPPHLALDVASAHPPRLGRGESLASARSHASHNSRSGVHGQVTAAVHHHLSPAAEDWPPSGAPMWGRSGHGAVAEAQDTAEDWPDTLAELLASSELDMPNGRESQDHLPMTSQSLLSPVAPRRRSGRSHPGPLSLNEFDSQGPFALPGARGLALRRSAQSPANGAQGAGQPMYGPPMGSIWAPAHAGSPLPMSRGGLNLQANWPGVSPAPGRGYDGDSGSFYDPQPQPHNHGSRASGLGPGQVPIGIKPSIQAQSAMLRELYPHGPGVAR